MTLTSIWTNGCSVQVVNPEDEAELTITRWPFGAELSLAPSANPPINKVYPLTFAIPTIATLVNYQLTLGYVNLRFNTFWTGKLQSVGSSGEIRRVDVHLGGVNIETFTDILEGDMQKDYPFPPDQFSVNGSVAITLSYRFNPIDRGALLIREVGAVFRHSTVIVI